MNVFDWQQLLSLFLSMLSAIMLTALWRGNSSGRRRMLTSSYILLVLPMLHGIVFRSWVLHRHLCLDLHDPSLVATRWSSLLSVHVHGTILGVLIVLVLSVSRKKED